MKSKSAFTVVELLAVVTIIVILSAISIFAYNGAQKDARDTTRMGNVTLISEALEKYYEKNGEYPSVASIVNTNPENTGEAVASKLSVPPESLLLPRTPSHLTNAISSEASPTEDTVVYIGVSDTNNTQCQTDINGGCDQYTLKYIKESSGDTQIIDSRRRSRAETAAPELALSGVTTTSINASWSAVSNASSYELQRSLASSFSSPVTTSHSTTSATASGLTANTEYFFRVRAISTDGSMSEWSGVQSETTSNLSAPTGTITISAAMSGTNARGTAGGGACPVGTTIEYQVRYYVNAGTWQAWTTGPILDVAATEGYRYTFQSQARCKSSTSNSPWAQSTTANIVRPITAPAAPVVSVSPWNGSQITWSWPAVTCPSGVTATYQKYYIREGYTTMTWLAPSTARTWSVSTTLQGFQYTAYVQARCETAYAQSSWSASGSASTITPIATPGIATNFGGTLSSDRLRYTWTWTQPTCGAGTSDSYSKNDYRAGAWSTTWSPWAGDSGTFTTQAPNGSPYPSGYTIGIRMKHKCVNTTTGRTSLEGNIGTSPIVTIP